MIDELSGFQNNSRRTIIAVITAIGAVAIALGMGLQLISLLMVEKGFSNSAIGYSGTVAGIATIIGAVFVSRIASYLGIAESILLMVFIGCLSFLGFYFFESLWIWFVLRFALHFTMTIMFVLLEFLINSSAPPQKRNLILSVYVITLGLGFTVGTALLAKIGIRGFMPVGTCCIFTAIATVPIFFAWKATPKFKKNERTAFFPYIFHTPTLTMAAFVYGAVKTGALTLTIPFSLLIGYSESESAQFMAMLALGNVFLLILIGFISDYVKNENYSLICCATLGFAGTLIISWIAEHKWLFMLDLFLLGGVSASLYIIGLAQLGTRFKGPKLAAANSAFMFCYGIGMLIGPTIAGQAMDSFKPFGFLLQWLAFLAYTSY